MSKHTRGPWEVVTQKQSRDGLIDASVSVRTADNSHRSICFQVGPLRSSTLAGLKDNEANARLIAAAPELLDALRNILEHPVVSGMSAAIRDHSKHQGEQDPYAAARTAISRATKGGGDE